MSEASPLSHDSSSSSVEPVRPRVPLHKQHLNRYFDDDAYFNAYSKLEVHEASIMDEAMITTYKQVIAAHSNLIRGKVYAVDANEHAATMAQEIVEEHNMSNQVIVIHSKIEDAEVEEVDVIISNWMGCLLFDENMLGSVIFARNTWLKRGGLILPSHAELYLGPVTYDDKHLRFAKWNSLYDINMSAVKSLARKQAFEEPIIERIEASNVFCSPHKIITVDCYRLQGEEVCINEEFSFRPLGDRVFHAFAFWFMAYFKKPGEVLTNKKRKRDDAVGEALLSTDPADLPTHWAQTLLYSYSPLLIKGNEKLKGRLQILQSLESPRFLDITVTYSVGDDVLERHATFRC